MIEQRDLDAAVAAGVIDAETRDRLERFARDRRQGTVGPDEEQFRLLTGFNDIFVSIAIGLLLFAVASLAGSLAPVVAPLAVTAVSWALAEYFTRVRRMALPSIILLLAFVGGVYAAAQAFFGNGLLAPITGSLAVPIGGALAAVAAAAHWLRFHVPITIAAGAAATSLLVIVLFGAILAAATGSGAEVLVPMVGLCGLGVFALAMWFDSRDLARVTRQTDVAFWLHLLAAPMIIHPVFAMTGLSEGTLGPGAAVIGVLVYLLLTAVALAIDRRALLVSALGYVIYAVNTLVMGGVGISAGFAVTALLMGLFLVLLSAAWRPVRAVVVGWMPVRIRERLPQAPI